MKRFSKEILSPEKWARKPDLYSLLLELKKAGS